MGIQKRMAVAVSGLVFAGGAALMVGGATSASAEALTAAPGQVTLAKSACGPRRGCCRRSCGCGGGFRNRSFRSDRQRIIVINKNNNISRSGFDRFDRPLRHRFGGFDRFWGGGDWGDGDWGDGGW